MQVGIVERASTCRPRAEAETESRGEGGGRRAGAAGVLSAFRRSGVVGCRAMCVVVVSMLVLMRRGNTGGAVINQSCSQDAATDAGVALKWEQRAGQGVTKNKSAVGCQVLGAAAWRPTTAAGHPPCLIESWPVPSSPSPAPTLVHDHTHTIQHKRHTRTGVVVHCIAWFSI